MTDHEVCALARWMHDVQSALRRLGVPFNTAAMAMGLSPYRWLILYADGYQPTGAAISYADAYMQEFTR